ncbi:unnamed protein product [Owenia fusiformis]|uniref:Uncharacterized protein n=1 Tax=Owenia fusiformis TaxID=6347 RepID=A0A8J1U0S2_OWEFU|nr:unnamed protein product [Owenia fusiformis]
MSGEKVLSLRDLRTLDDCDGIFVSHEDKQDSFDEVDSSRVILVTKDTDVPKTYAERADKSGYDEIDQINFRLVSKKWGISFTTTPRGPGVCGLIQINGAPLIKSIVESLWKYWTTLISGIHFEPVRFDESGYLLVWFASSSCYAGFAAKMTAGLLNMDKLRVVSLEAAEIANPPKVSLEVETSPSNTNIIMENITQAVIPFSAAFTFLAIHERIMSLWQPSVTPEGSVPSVGINLLFDGRNQANALRSLKALQSDQWENVTFPSAIKDRIPEELQLYRNRNQGLPAIGLRTGCPQAGVEICVLVQDPANFTKMEQFYEDIIGHKPVNRASGDHCKYSVFAVSRKSELVLGYYPGVVVGNSQNVSICVQVDGANIGGAKETSKGHWVVPDPEGNHVQMFKIL